MRNNLSKILKASLSLGLAFLLAAPAWALQTIESGDGRSHVVKISLKELTRITVEGAKIRRIDFPDDDLVVEKDVEAGFILVRPNVPKPINAFITTSTGATHALVMQPTDMPLETIVIREPSRKDDPKRTTTRIERAGSLELSVKRLVYAMARGDKPSEFDVATVNRQVGLWNEATFVLLERYTGRSLIGERYRLTNVSKAVMRLSEQELYKQGVVAVSVEQHVLNPGESTDVFITRVANDG